MRSRWALAICLLVPKALPAQVLSAEVKAFVSVDAPVVALTHVRVMDGTGGPAREDQTLVISGGKIQAVGAAPAVPAGAKVMDLSGYTVIPGLVGMHDHLFYPQGGGFFAEMGLQFPAPLSRLRRDDDPDDRLDRAVHRPRDQEADRRGQGAGPEDARHRARTSRARARSSRSSTC